MQPTIDNISILINLEIKCGDEQFKNIMISDTFVYNHRCLEQFSLKNSALPRGGYVVKILITYSLLDSRGSKTKGDFKKEPAISNTT